MQNLPTDPNLLSWVLLLTAALLIATLILAWLKPWRLRIRRKSLMTPNEAEFYRRLERALPAYRVFPQVSFAAFLTDDGTMSQRRRWSVRARFDRKIADFVVCDGKTLEIVALIELDDATHTARADRARDAMTKTAGYPDVSVSIQAEADHRRDSCAVPAFRGMDAWTDGASCQLLNRVVPVVDLFHLLIQEGLIDGIGAVVSFPVYLFLFDFRLRHRSACLIEDRRVRLQSVQLFLPPLLEIVRIDQAKHALRIVA